MTRKVQSALTLLNTSTKLGTIGVRRTFEKNPSDPPPGL